MDAVHEGGDHWIVVGQVVSIHRSELPREPLVFFGGRYSALANDQQSYRKKPACSSPGQNLGSEQTGPTVRMGDGAKVQFTRDAGLKCLKVSIGSLISSERVRPG